MSEQLTGRPSGPDRLESSTSDPSEQDWTEDLGSSYVTRFFRKVGLAVERVFFFFLLLSPGPITDGGQKDAGQV